MRRLIVLLISISPLTVMSQVTEDFVFGRVSAGTIVKTVKFAGLNSNGYDVVRIDNMGEGIPNPIILTRNKIASIDDFRHPDTLMVDNQAFFLLARFIGERRSLFHERRITGTGVYRITYRTNGILGQYYLNGGERTSRYFRDLAKVLIPSVGPDTWIVEKLNSLAESALRN